MIAINIQIATFTKSGLQVRVHSKGDAHTDAETLYFKCLKFGIEEGIKVADKQMAELPGAPAAAPSLPKIQGVQLQPLAPAVTAPPPPEEFPLFSRFAEELIGAFQFELTHAKDTGEAIESPLMMAERHEKLVREYCAAFSRRILKYQDRLGALGKNLSGGAN